MSNNLAIQVLMDEIKKNKESIREWQEEKATLQMKIDATILHIVEGHAKNDSLTEAIQQLSAKSQ